MSESGDGDVLDYRHDQAKRKNNPPAGLAAQGRIAERPADQYAYNPHLPPALRFDTSGKADKLPELLETARNRKLTAEEVETLAAALRNQEPWLEWTGKREKRGFQVDAVPLHIHERVAAKAILAVAARQDVQRDLFADPELEYRQAVQFYQHDVDWSNRLILGDSLMVMSSLAKREDLAGKVQMIYVDPPYGIKFASNFQPQVGQRNVTDRPADLTREPEMVKAYRDTWTLGVHSYLAYLRDRLIAARELLTDSGSMFVQIGDENVHLVRSLMDEVFGRGNFVSQILYRRGGFQTGDLMANTFDYILWYARSVEQMKGQGRPVYISVGSDDWYPNADHWVERPDGSRAPHDPMRPLPPGGALHSDRSCFSATGGEASGFAVELDGSTVGPLAGRGWSTNEAGVRRLLAANRLMLKGRRPRYKPYFSDFPFQRVTNGWMDTVRGGFTGGGENSRVFVVQTNTKVIERCLLMTTDPGDLVLDPTCGSGTTAYVAEQWGRRWITVDTSRVALAIARQRILTAAFDYYRLRDEGAGPSGGFQYKRVPHITLKSIAQNPAIDTIAAKHQPILAERLTALNAALAKVPADVRARLAAKLAAKEKAEGKRSVTDADRRRWLLPKEPWRGWEVAFDADCDWPEPLRAALAAYRAAWRAKMDEVNQAIAANAESEELVDQPEVKKGITRVSGPFTVEAVLPPEEKLDVEPSPVEEPDEELGTFEENGTSGEAGAGREATNAGAYLERMLKLLKADGVRFPDNKVMKFARLDPLEGDVLHAAGEWVGGDGVEREVAVSFGPQYGPVTARQVEDCLRVAYRRGYDDVVFAGFSFDAAAQAIIEEDPNPRVRAHFAHIRPDVNMGDLLKETPNSQIFTVFGLPRTSLKPTADGQWTITMEGVDVYNPVTNTVESTGASKVAAWFVDGDYDGRTFCITQAFFPDKSAWERLARALKSVVDESVFGQLSGTTSLPFPTGKHRKAAVKVIDPRGNEVMRVHHLGGVRYA